MRVKARRRDEPRDVAICLARECSGGKHTEIGRHLGEQASQDAGVPRSRVFRHGAKCEGPQRALTVQPLSSRERSCSDSGIG